MEYIILHKNRILLPYVNMIIYDYSFLYLSYKENFHCFIQLLFDIFHYLIYSNVDVIIYFQFDRYNIQWYMCPVHVQKLVILLLQRRTKEFHLTCGGLFVASFECFATVNNSNTYIIYIFIFKI